MRLKKRRFILFSLLFLISSSAYGATVSVSNTFVANEQYSSDFHTNLNTNFTELVNGVNNIESDQITNDTLAEADMADEINPRIRTYEGASCEFTYTGLLPAVDAVDLTTDTSSGTAYPRGYRCVKTSATSHTYASNAWTYVDIDQNCDFQYSQVSVGAATPSIASNAIRLARVSTDSGVVDTVTDLRTTNCAAASFSEIKDGPTQASLEDILQDGKDFVSADNGWVRGFRVSYDTATTFIVTEGSAYFPTSGEYRANDAEITVQQQADDPSVGISGIDTGTTSASTRYFVYLAADEDGVASASVTYSASAVAPSGVTNYRKIGSILSGASSKWQSHDVLTHHVTGDYRLVDAWIGFDGSAATPGPTDYSYNVSAITDGGAGTYTVTFKEGFHHKYYGLACIGGTSDAKRLIPAVDSDDVLKGSFKVIFSEDGVGGTDCAYCGCIVTGDAL